MSQRRSGYPRRLADDYPAPAWATLVVVPYLPARIDHGWDPAEGEGAMVRVLNEAGMPTIGTGDNFLTLRRLPDPRIDAVITNPPYGYSGQLAHQFIEHALTLVPIVAMLLRVDFDSGRTRQHLFRNCPAFTCKVALLDRIEWFPGEYGSSTNHAWFIWDCEHRGPPTIAYAGKADVAAARRDLMRDMNLYRPVVTSQCAGTSTAGEWGYVVNDEVWDAAWADRLKSWHAVSGQQILCIDCLEKRIHRKLTAADFMKTTLNDPGYGHKSARLLDRLASPARTPALTAAQAAGADEGPAGYSRAGDVIRRRFDSRLVARVAW